MTVFRFYHILARPIQCLATLLLNNRKLVLIFLALYAVGQSVRQAHVVTNTDVYHTAAKRLVAGEKIYQVGDQNPFKYMPIIAFFSAPLGVVDVIAARVLWFLAMLAVLVACYFVLIRLAFVVWPGDPLSKRYVVLGMLASLWVFLNHFGSGQIHVLILFLCCTALWAQLEQRWLLGGICMALAISVKLSPVLFLPYFLFKGQWRMLFATFFGLLLCLLVPALFVGFDDALTLHLDYINLLQARTEHNMWDPRVYTENSNIQSLFTSWVQKEAVVYKGIAKHLFYVPLAVVKGLFTAFTLALGFLLAAMMWRRQDKHSVLLEYSIVMLLTVLFAPLAWRYTFVVLAPIHILFARQLSMALRQSKISRFMNTGFILFSVHLLVMYSMQIPYRYKLLPLFFNLFCLTSLSLLLWLSWGQWRRRLL